MATKAVLLAQRNKDGADLLLPNTSADLVGYKHEETKADNVKGALDELMAAKPDIVQRVEALENKFDGGGGGIPFEDGNICTVTNTVDNPETTNIVIGDISIKSPDYSSDGYSITGIDKFISLENDYILVEKSGFYDISFFYAYNLFSNASAVELESIIFVNGVAQAQESYYAIQGVATPDTHTLSKIIKLNTGDKVHIGCRGNSDYILPVKWTIQFFKIPVTNEYQVRNAEYFGLSQTQYVPAVHEILPEDNTKRFFNIDWTVGGIVQETPDLLTIKNNTELVPYRTGMALLNFNLDIQVATGSRIFDLYCQVFRRDSSGKDVLVRAGTFRIYEGQINNDSYNLFILLPMSEGESVWFRVLMPAEMNWSINYAASLSGTILPSIIETTKVHHKHQAYTEYQDGTRLSFPVPAKEWVDCPSEEFTPLGKSFDLFSVYNNHWKVKHAGTYRITFNPSVPASSISGGGYLCLIGILGMDGTVYAQEELDYSNVPITDGVASVQCVREFEAGEEFRTCFLYGKAGTAHVGKTIVSVLWLDAQENVIDIPNIDIFTPPTADAPGKAGLVPGPPQITSRSIINQFLSGQGWRAITTALLGLDQITQTPVLVPTTQPLGRQDANTLPAGVYNSQNWVNTPNPNGLLLTIQGIETGDTGYYALQLFLDYGGKVWLRTTRSNEVPGTWPEWQAWALIGTPRPQTGLGGGQWTGYSNQGSGNTITLPAGEVWAYFFTAYNADGSVYGVNGSVRAGGSTISFPSTVKYIEGFTWNLMYS